MKYFALIDSDNVVQSVMPVPLEALEEDYAQKFGMTCIETKKDGSIRNRFAGKGCLYDSQNDAFVGRKPYDSWVFDASAGDWAAPVAKPADADDYVWDEELTQWRRQVEISSEISDILSSADMEILASGTSEDTYETMLPRLSPEGQTALEGYDR
jgi:hypothetical protein|tara:strand:- start:942 stop:1406 length:465 start_codon:yes stop_codon:yes gene_type:complete